MPLEDLSAEQPSPEPAAPKAEPYNPDRDRENIRGELARRLLWLLVVAVGGVLLFVGMGLVEGAVFVQSVIPSLVALTGTALGFYFGTQSSGDRPT